MLRRLKIFPGLTYQIYNEYKNDGGPEVTILKFFLSPANVWAYQALIKVWINKYVLLFVDINECKVNNGGCDEKCINTIGSFFCKCNFDGHKMIKGKTSCEGSI